MRRPELLVCVLFLSACPASDDDDDKTVLPDPCAAVTCEAGMACGDDGLCHCGAGGPTCGAGELCTDGACITPLADRCNLGVQWIAPAPAFRDATAEWGLVDLGVEGTRLAVGDIDGDGWADLLVRRGGNGSDDFAPGGVRRTWLLRNQGDGTFADVTVQSNLRMTRTSAELGRPGEVVAFGDVDNDGDLDVFTGMSTGIDGAMAGETSELMFNDGSGRFTFGALENAVRRTDDVDIVAGAAFIDYDRDGLLDLFVGQHNYTPAGTQAVVFRHDLLYRNTGAGQMIDVTAEAGLVTADWGDTDVINAGRAHSRAWSVAACDLNDDGTTELLAASYGRAPNHLWRGERQTDGTITFANESVASGYAYDDKVDWTDNEFARCYCQSVPTAEGCPDPLTPPRITCSQPNWNHASDREAFRLGGNSGTTVCADIDNDGAIDLFTTEITHWWAGTNADRSELLVNDGALHFTRPGLRETGLERFNPPNEWDNGDMTAAVFDFDNDGKKDVYIGASDYPGNHGLLFRQKDTLQFERVPIDLGIDHHRSHGLAVADFDHDGDLDVVVGHSRARCQPGADPCYDTAQVRFFENVIGDIGNWVQLELEGAEGTNRSAIGARVTIETDDGIQVQEVGGGHGHYGIQHDLVLHFGLARSCRATVTVRWPDAALTTQTFEVQPGYRFHVRQGERPEAVGI